MSNKEETIVKVKFKSQSRFQGTTEVAKFVGGDGRAWLEFMHKLEMLYDFLKLTGSNDDAEGFRDCIIQLLTGDNLSEFQDVMKRVVNNGQSTYDAINLALERLTDKHCAKGSVKSMEDELKNLHKTRAMSVEDYYSRFTHIVGLLKWLVKVETTTISTEELVEAFHLGMPRAWQAKVRDEQDWTDLGELKKRYRRIELNETKMAAIGHHDNVHKKEKKQQNHKQKSKKPVQRQVTTTTTDTRKRPRDEYSGDGCSWCFHNGGVLPLAQGSRVLEQPGLTST